MEGEVLGKPANAPTGSTQCDRGLVAVVQTVQLLDGDSKPSMFLGKYPASGRFLDSWRKALVSERRRILVVWLWGRWF